MSDVAEEEWSWVYALPGSWQNRHNLRAAGAGMPWPDLAIVPEGSLSRIVWWAREPRQENRGLRFLTSGAANIRTDALRRELESFVEIVIERLRDAGIGATPLEREWTTIRSADDEERAFAAAVGRLGLDPYSIDEDLAAAVQELGQAFEHDQDLVSEILDVVDPSSAGLSQMGSWLSRAERAAATTAAQHANGGPASSIYAQFTGKVDPYQPWRAGYEAAGRLRALLGGDGRVIDINGVIAKASVRGSAGGLEAYTTRRGGHAVLLVPGRGIAPSTAHDRFLRARSLGVHVLEPKRTRFVVTGARTPLQRAARAFAAELLAPAGVVKEELERLGGRPSDASFDAVARQLKVSPLLVKHQYDNQIRVPHPD